jgi:hypothetical protein
MGQLQPWRKKSRRVPPGPSFARIYMIFMINIDFNKRDCYNYLGFTGLSSPVLAEAGYPFDGKISKENILNV